MNLNPDQDAPTLPEIDQSLLDAAFAEATPDELEAKILALTDPQMISLLDEAMAPEANEQLTQRILAATQQHMRPGTVPTATPSQTVSVFARIGPTAFRYAAAAAIALAVGLGVYFVSQASDDADTTIANTTGGVDDENASDTSGADPDWLASEQYASTDGFFDSATSPVEEALDGLADSLDDVNISRETLWAELDAYEQFLTEIES